MTVAIENIETIDFINDGIECGVYSTPDDNVVLKQYHENYSQAKVDRIVQLNREYVKRGLAPQVYSNAIEINGRWSYLVERIELPLKRTEKQVYELADQLGVSDDRICELAGNWGFTKDGNAVLFDFGIVTMRILGLIPCGDTWDDD